MRESASPSYAAQYKPRAAQRCALRIPAQIRLASGKTVAIEVRNISPGGLSGLAAGFVAIGTDVEILIADKPAIPGRIMWQLGNSTGVSFGSELSTAAILGLSLEHLRLPDDEAF